MKAYKGFDKDLKCNDFQYKVGKTYETDKAELCERGFHACEAPLNTFRYYPPATSRYCEVELDGVSEQKDDDTKRAAKKITIGAEIGIPGIVKAHVEWVKANVTRAVETGDAEAVSVGEKEAASAGRYGSVSAGRCGYAFVGARGSASAGRYGSASAGEYGSAVSRGKSAVGENGVAVARGDVPKVKGGIGSVLVLVEEKGKGYDIHAWKAVVVDGETIRADTWYTLQDGELVEVEMRAAEE